MEELEPIKKDVEITLYENQEVVINSKEEYTQAGDIIKAINQKIKNIEAKRVDYTKPLLDQKKKIDDDFKAAMKPLEELVKNIKDKMIIWSREEQKRLDEEQKKLEKEAMEKAKKDKTSEVVVPIINDIKSQRGEVSTSTIKKIWKWKVTEETKVPREYLMINDKALNEAVRNGERKIEGIEIYQEEQISIR